MFCRFIAAALILLTASVPASALTAKLDEPLAAAAGRMRVKDFAGAREAAIKSGEKGSKAFLLGMADIKLEHWEEAASQLGYAADNYPILADYALYNQGLALSKLNRVDEALPPLYKLLKQYPESRLGRPALILYADLLAAGGHAKEALESYTMFIERYASGSDAISAVFGSALCREKLGEPKAAAEALRGIWLTYPASPFAAKASAELERLATAGTNVAPYTPGELLKRGSTLYDLGKYKQAIDALAAVPTRGASDDFVSKLQLKLGQAQLKARRYEDAQTTLRSLSQKGSGSIASEATYWLGRALDKSGNAEEAFNIYLRLADSPKAGAVADDALLEAAYLRRFQHRWSEAAVLFKRFLASYPNEKNSTVVWEAAWASYECRDYAGAAAYFRKAAERDEMREKALYWLGKSVAASGDAKGAEVHFAALASEYPFGYYALLCNRWCDNSAFPAAPKALKESLPMPAGFEREKALITLGLYDEAGRELNAKKNKNALGIARLYLEMANYNGAFHAASREKLRRAERDTSPVWGLNYPLAFNEEVAKHASANALPESLVYAIMRTESNYSPAALSPVGAVGLMQIMPATAEKMSKGDSSKLTRPELNIRLGARHLKDLLSMYDKNLVMSIAAYNAGSGNVKRWQKYLAGLPQDEYIENIPFRETREYVKKVLTAMELYQRLYRMPEQKQKNQGI